MVFTGLGSRVVLWVVLLLQLLALVSLRIAISEVVLALMWSYPGTLAPSTTSSTSSSSDASDSCEAKEANFLVALKVNNQAP
eukprot:1270320-Rhodomonas_salina.1